VRGNEPSERFAGIIADIFVVIVQCFGERGDCAWIAQHAEYLRGKSASVIVTRSFISIVLDYPDERFDGASVAKFLERF
jgi:hypothetical protein